MHSSSTPAFAHRRVSLLVLTHCALSRAFLLRLKSPLGGEPASWLEKTAGWTHGGWGSGGGGADPTRSRAGPRWCPKIGKIAQIQLPRPISPAGLLRVIIYGHNGPKWGFGGLGVGHTVSPKNIFCLAFSWQLQFRLLQLCSGTALLGVGGLLAIIICSQPDS